MDNSQWPEGQSPASSLQPPSPPPSSEHEASAANDNGEVSEHANRNPNENPDENPDSSSTAAPAPQAGQSSRGGRSSRRRAIWRGILSIRGQSEEIKIDVKAYPLRGRSNVRPSWPNTLVCDYLGLEGSENAGYLASRMNNPGLAYLQALSPSGEEVAHPRMTKVAEVIEERGAAFTRTLEGYMVIASRDTNNEIGLYVLYDRE